MNYANKKGVPYVLMIGENEIKEGKYQLKNMKTGEQMFYPGAGDWKAGQSLPEIQMSAVQFKWQMDKPDIFARAMVLADKTLFVAGPPDLG